MFTPEGFPVPKLTIWLAEADKSSDTLNKVVPAAIAARFHVGVRTSGWVCVPNYWGCSPRVNYRTHQHPRSRMPREFDVARLGRQGTSRAPSRALGEGEAGLNRGEAWGRGSVAREATKYETAR